MVGSLTGAVASQRVTERAMVGSERSKSFVEYNGISLPDCETNKSSRDESRHSDPVVPRGWPSLNGIKGTPG